MNVYYKPIFTFLCVVVIIFTVIKIVLGTAESTDYSYLLFCLSACIVDIIVVLLNRK